MSSSKKEAKPRSFFFSIGLPSAGQSVASAEAIVATRRTGRLNGWRASAFAASGLRDHQRLVILLRCLGDEGVDGGGDGVADIGRGVTGVVSEQRLQLVVSELIARSVFRFGDAVAVEDYRRTGRERARLRHISRRAENADGKPVRLQLLDAIAGQHVTRIVACVDELQR